MKKDFLKKIITKLILTTTITMLLPLGVSAQWKQNLDRTWSYADGNSLVNGWKNISEQWYYFNSNGRMQKDWVYDKGNWYHLDNTGAMQIGWIEDCEKWYYLNSSGEMQTGWIKDNGKWYYTDSTGAMLTGSISIGSKIYNLNESGELQQTVENPDQENSSVNNSPIDVNGLPKLSQNYSVNIQEFAEGKILELMNEKRMGAGLSTLVLDNTLLQIARYKSNDMIQNNYFDHTTPQGQKWTSWLDTINYQYTTTGENIAYNNYDPVQLFNQWWNSPEHKANMMNSSYTKVGIGVLEGNGKYMGTQTFSN